MICPYCNERAEFISSKDFYGTDYKTNLYVCEPCDARVGTHKGSKTPLGTMANEKLRKLRKRCHLAFDPKWKSGKMTRTNAYRWLQQEMNLTPEEAHIGMFDEERCLKLLEILGVTITNTEKVVINMDLKALAAGILAEGFDPATSPVSDFEELPDGVYDALLKEVEWRVSDSGFEWLSLQFEVLNEGFEGRIYFAMISFVNEKMVALNMKRAMKTAHALGIALSPEDFDQPEVGLVEAFQQGLGGEVELELTGWENKKTGKKGQNFDVSVPLPFD